MWFSLKKAFLNSSFLWWHEGDKNKFYTLVILSLYKIPVTREPSRWPTSLKNSQSIHPLLPTPSKISEVVKIGMTIGLEYAEIGYTIV